MLKVIIDQCSIMTYYELEEVEGVSRIVKNPDERRRELLVTAMRLFAEEGYDNVSVRAVARAAGVAPGLAYHYFDSKQNMFDAAIEEYSRRCAEGIIAILDDRGLSLDEKLDRAIEAGPTPARSTTPTSSTRRATARSTTGSRWACARRCNPISARARARRAA